MNLTFDPVAKEQIDKWLSEDYDSDTKEQIQTWLRENNPALSDHFYTDLDFGTGGMRGVMGIGPNRMNIYTIKKATQGLANYIKKQNIDSPSVIIGYDSRMNSRLFAEKAAEVLAGNGIRVYLFKEIRPTPLVSFGCRYKHCTSGIMITASHNPPEYNGYKVYWSDGAQILPPHDKGIIQEVRSLRHLNEIHAAPLNSPLIEEVLEEIDTAYLQAIQTLKTCPGKSGDALKVIYTSLHGVGITLFPAVMKSWGFSSISYVDSQIVPDPHFPHAKSPNPEEKEALEEGIKKLTSTQSDILIATDPDADRVGVAVLHKGIVHLLNGNQISCLCLEHILNYRKLPQNPAFIKTIATTELFKTICDKNNVACFDVLTGFKYVAEKIREWDHSKDYNYVFGGEESYGYLYGTSTRDKDALSAAALICEIALEAKLQGKTLIDNLLAIYRKYGLFHETLKSIKFPETKEGREQMSVGLKSLRQNPPRDIGGIPIQTCEDYLTRVHDRSDMIVFWLTDGSKLVIRPSGTEPKIKIYCGVSAPAFEDYDKSIVELELKCEKLVDALKSLLS